MEADTTHRLQLHVQYTCSKLKEKPQAECSCHTQQQTACANTVHKAGTRGRSYCSCSTQHTPRETPEGMLL